MNCRAKGYVCFYADHLTNEFISVDDEVFMELDKVLASLQSGVLEYPKNIWGIIDEKGNSLQFFVNQDGTIEMNISVPKKLGSYTKMLEKSECYTLVCQAQQYIEDIEIEDAEFRDWWVE